jgi:hypothetical protein
LYKVKEDLLKYEKFKGRLSQDMRDINKLTTDSLYDAVKDFDLTLATTTKSERKTSSVHPGAKLAFDGPTWKVIEIENKGAIGKEAACFYGGNNKETRWCTSAPGLASINHSLKNALPQENHSSARSHSVLVYVKPTKCMRLQRQVG